MQGNTSRVHQAALRYRELTQSGVSPTEANARVVQRFHISTDEVESEVAELSKNSLTLIRLDEAYTKRIVRRPIRVKGRNKKRTPPPADDCPQIIKCPNCNADMDGGRCEDCGLDETRK